jgi:DNA-binding MarR family transcriptional regulator
MASNSDFALWRIMDHTRFMIARSREMELASCSLTPEQSHVLDILHESGGSTTINRLVEVTQRQHHSISTLIDRMTRQGLVTRRKSPSDKRKYDVAITEKGEELVNEMPRGSVDSIFESLSADEKVRLRSYLMRLMKGAYAVLGKEMAGPFHDERSD